MSPPHSPQSVREHLTAVCRSCGRVVDLDRVVGVAPRLDASQRSGFVIDEAEITFWGTCPTCTR